MCIELQHMILLLLHHPVSKNICDPCSCLISFSYVFIAQEIHCQVTWINRILAYSYDWKQTYPYFHKYYPVLASGGLEHCKDREPCRKEQNMSYILARLHNSHLLTDSYLCFISMAILAIFLGNNEKKNITWRWGESDLNKRKAAIFRKFERVL